MVTEVSALPNRYLRSSQYLHRRPGILGISTVIAPSINHLPSSYSSKSSALYLNSTSVLCKISFAFETGWLVHVRLSVHSTYPQSTCTTAFNRVLQLYKIDPLNKTAAERGPKFATGHLMLCPFAT